MASLCLSFAGNLQPALSFPSVTISQYRTQYIPNSETSLEWSFRNELVATGLHLGPAVQEHSAKNNVTTIWDLKPARRQIPIADPD
ncbi:BZ3500_MvSof-1268-A1-R1_Chr10-1g02706 [Microbotryum saponariae]|uniref:BZ3500_MvSof-1268-A1-R1_Chr10-1g02706 protein n=1 Tax=Microbotryum saponariae TaxID=289078 RepID=A0A2X0L9T1_9BASI|nr:BZ3500_MvSof-1268-A1-R1_Chr10-1g02706 [Microbotryum saponariae]SDA06195.1 BZ3501_MvSof-1269-A2-R1_Chr10-1g02307 [Microbotryum saponariae]